MNSEHYPQTGLSDACALLARSVGEEFHALLGQIEGASTTMASEAKRHQERLHGIETRLSSLEESLCGIQGRLEGIHDALGAFYKRRECEEAAGKQALLLTEQHHRCHVVAPFARALIRVMGFNREMRRHAGGPGKLTTLLECEETLLLEFLAAFGVSRMSESTGHAFDPKLMKPAVVEPCLKEEFDRVVLRVVEDGFAYDDGTILKPQSVVVGRFRKLALSPGKEE